LRGAKATKQSIFRLAELQDGLLRFARNDGLAKRAALSLVITREGGRPSIPEAPENESRGRGVLDRPVKPDDDSSEN
jgi:hypothetical protein